MDTRPLFSPIMWPRYEARAVAPQTVVLHTLYCNTLISVLSLQVSTVNLSRWLMHISLNLVPLSSGVSGANLLHWLVLIWCNLLFSPGFSSSSLSLMGYNLISLSSGVSFAILSRSWVFFRCKLACFSPAVCLARSLSLHFLNL